MFAFHRQPLKGIYLTYVGLTTIFFRLPYWTLKCIPRSSRPRKSWSITKSLAILVAKVVIVVLYKVSFPEGFTENLDDANNSAKFKATGFTIVPKFPENILVGEIKDLAARQNVIIDRTFGFWYQRKGASEQYDRPAGQDEKIALLFHGGAMTMGTLQPGALGSSEPVVNCILEHNPSLSRIFNGGYRLSSSSPFPAKNPFPAALFDAIACYHYLVHDMGFKPENIIVGGDSAGGFLALALTRYLVVNNLPELPLHGGLLLLSPSTEWLPTHGVGPNSSMERNDKSDVCRLIYEAGYTLRSLAGTLDMDEVLANPWFSPASLKLPKDVVENLFIRFPKTFIHVGEAEVHLDATRTVHERLVKAIGEDNVRYIEHSDVTHDVLTIPVFEPERTEISKEIHAWIKSL